MPTMYDFHSTTSTNIHLNLNFRRFFVKQYDVLSEKFSNLVGEFINFLRGQCHEICCHFFISWIEAIWVPDKQAKMVLLKIRFLGDICEKFDFAQC